MNSVRSISLVANRLGASCLLGLALALLSVGVSAASTNSHRGGGNPTAGNSAVEPAPPGDEKDPKWSLWTHGTQLRGANIWQKVIDDPNEIGDGIFEPCYRKEDFIKLRNWGANFVNFSVPGVFSEHPDANGKYVNLPIATKELDRLIDMAAQAGLWIVVGFRTGPERNENGFDDEAPPATVNHSIWKNTKAQDAWVEMWRWFAERHKNHPRIAAYDLMVEPNSNAVLPETKGKFEGKSSGHVFMEKYSNSSIDWNQLAKRITAAIRATGDNTPIIVSTMNWGNAAWLDTVVPTGDLRTIYSVHFYEPYPYSSDPALKAVDYPGMIQVDDDPLKKKHVDKKWLDRELRVVEEFRRKHPGRPVVTNEFGPIRWKKGADRYYADLISLFEARGMNYAVWIWEPEKEPPAHNHWNFQFGPDEKNKSAVSTSHLIEAIKNSWKLNPR